MTTLIGNSTGNLIVASLTRLMLPSGLNSIDRTRWDSGGTNLPSGACPLSRADEGRILLNLIGELNQTLSLNLDPSPDLQPANAAGKVSATFLVAGASSADRTADALEHAGQTVKRATIPGWRCTKQKASMMVELVAEKLQGVMGQCTVVFQYENSFFRTRTEEGGLVPAV